MASKTKKRGASREQKKLMKEFYDHTGFAFMGEDRISADNPGEFIREWERNCQWLRDVANETDRFINDYMAKNDCSKHGF